MSAIDEVFSRLRQAGRKAFVPFITAGDPDLAFTEQCVRELAGTGCSLCEIGIPYSDPIADGPVIQASYTRALAQRIHVEDIFGVTRRLRDPRLGESIATPLVTMVSYAIVHRYGLEKYVDDAIQAGVSGAIVPDLLIEESPRLAGICRQRDFSLIQLVTPTTPRERAVRIAESSTGFLYYVSVTGITGERTALPTDLTDNVAWLKARTSLPICIGFGISQPEHVRLLSPVADGLIVGSAFVRRISQCGTGKDQRSREQVLGEIRQLSRELQAAMVEQGESR